MDQHKTNNSKILISLSIVLAGILIFVGIFTPYLGLPAMNSLLRKLTPKFPKYQQAKDLSDYSNILTVINSQPSVSYNSSTQFYLIEVGGFNCFDCAKNHGFSSQAPYTFTEINENYIETGKVNYVWLDTDSSSDNKMSNSAYCVGEQNPSKQFEYNEILFKNYGSKFDLETAKSYVKNLNIDLNKFENCFNSNKYSERIKKLSELTSATFSGVNGGFLLYKVEEKQVKKIDGNVENQKVPTLIGIFASNTNYEQKIKPQLELVLK